MQACWRYLNCMHSPHQDVAQGDGLGSQLGANDLGHNAAARYAWQQCRSTLRGPIRHWHAQIRVDYLSSASSSLSLGASAAPALTTTGLRAGCCCCDGGTKPMRCRGSSGSCKQAAQRGRHVCWVSQVDETRHLGCCWIAPTALPRLTVAGEARQRVRCCGCAPAWMQRCEGWCCGAAGRRAPWLRTQSLSGDWR